MPGRINPVEHTPGPDGEAPERVSSLEGYDVLGYVAAVATASFRARAAVHQVLRGFGPVDNGHIREWPRYELTPQANGWRVLVDGAEVHSGGEFLPALGVLEWHITSAALADRSDLFHLHGAALRDPAGGGGLVLVGSSGSGKTTMALALMQHGFEPFTDDVTLLDPVTLELFPFRRAFHLEEGTRALIDSLGGAPVPFDQAAPSGYFSPSRWADRSVPVRWMLFLDRQPQRAPQLIPLLPPDAAAAVLAHTLSLTGTPRLALATAARLVERAACYRFVTGDLEASLAMVEQLVASAVDAAASR